MSKRWNYLLTHSVRESADRYPDHAAFRCGNDALTFAELAERMDQLAGLLLDLGVRKGDRVGIYLNRSLETAVAIYGIMRAGAAYVPLDPTAPPERTAALLRDCEIRQLISQPAQSRNLKKILETANGLTQLIGLKTDWPIETISWEAVWDLPDNRTIIERSTAQDLAYVMYTSGSTGKPKGIMHTHYSGLSYAQLSAGTYGLDHSDRIGNHAPIYFDISTLGYFTAPLVGATTVIVPDAYTKMPASLSQLMAQEQLTVWYSVPLALIQLLQRGVLEERDLSCLRWVLFGGEVFPPKYLRKLMQCWPRARFSNVYGPAEVNQCTFYHLDSPPATDEPIPLGCIWDNTQMLILDEEDREAPAGSPGELAIRSATMMQGYWNRPDLTDKSFFKRNRIPGFPETFYRTGDLVRLDEAGQLQFIGRKDQQVKVRGYRVELEAVESELAALAAVKEAAVFSGRNQAGEIVIAGAVLLHESGSITEKELINSLKNQLPVYALPQQVFIVETFPRTGSGKTDRPALKATLLNQTEQIHG